MSSAFSSQAVARAVRPRRSRWNWPSRMRCGPPHRRSPRSRWWLPTRTERHGDSRGIAADPRPPERSRRGQCGIRCPTSPTSRPVRSADSRWRAPGAGVPGRRRAVRLPRPLRRTAADSLAGAALHRRMGAAVGDAVLRCPQCRAHFDVVHAGACIDENGDASMRISSRCRSSCVTVCCRSRSPRSKR